MNSEILRVLDTNLLLVANGQHKDASPECVISCIQLLQRIQHSGGVVIDEDYEILREYLRKTSPFTGNRVGDAFLRWLIQNSQNTKFVECVRIQKHDERVYVEFPDDPDLTAFDHSDRKFVATSLAHATRPAICQGTDSKWQVWSERLIRHGIQIEFLCPADVHRFLERKMAK